MDHDETRGLYQRGDTWWLQLPMKNRIRPKPISLQTPDLTEAISRAKECRHSPVLAAAGSLEAEMEKHLAYKRSRARYSKISASKKHYTLLAFVDFLPKGTTMSSVTPEQVQEFYDSVLIRTSAATAHKHLMDVRAWFRWALEVEKKIRRNPAEGVRREPVPDGARVLFCTEEQRDKLINECPKEHLKFVLMMGFHCGLRKQEIIEAVPAWFNVAGHFLDLQPTPTMPFNAHKKPRTVPMRRCVIDFLKQYGLREPFMLRPEVKAGKNLYRYDFDVALKTYVRSQGMEWVTAHVMRHTFASLLVISGTSIFKVAKWLGDTVATTEKHYAHLAPKDDDIEERPRPAT